MKPAPTTSGRPRSSASTPMASRSRTSAMSSLTETTAVPARRSRATCGACGAGTARTTASMPTKPSGSTSRTFAGERGRGALGTLRVSVGYEELFHARCGQPLTEGPNADGAGAQDAEPHQRGSRTGSSCEPPPWGGTPPWPRTRSAAATAPATTRAATARRKTFTALAVRWWQGGSRSSCAKHTRRLRLRCRGDIRGGPRAPNTPQNRPAPRPVAVTKATTPGLGNVGCCGASWNRTSDLILIRDDQGCSLRVRLVSARTV